MSFFQASCSVEENIATTLLDQFSPMFNEPDFLLREELKEVEKYHTVLMALADNRNTISEIADFSGISVRVMPYYLRTLRELGYIGRHTPLTGERPNARVVRYVLRDPLLRFWFRFIFPHQSLLLAGENAAPMLALIRRELDSYFGSCFENLCREALAVSYAKRQILTKFEIVEYWDKNIQIDVVGVREDNRIDLGECKWGKFDNSRSPITQQPDLLPACELHIMKIIGHQCPGITLSPSFLMYRASIVQERSADQHHRQICRYRPGPEPYHDEHTREQRVLLFLAWTGYN